MSVKIDPASSPRHLAGQIVEMIRETVDDVGPGTSTLSKFLAEYRTTYTGVDRTSTQLAYELVLGEASRALSLEQTRRELPTLLYMGARVITGDDLRVRTALVRHLRRAVETLLIRAEYPLAVSCLNLYVDAALSESAQRLTNWTRTIGFPAVLPAFQVLARFTPRRAIQWLLVQDFDDDLVVSTFEGTVELIQTGFFSTGVGRSLGASWLFSQFNEQLQESDSRTTLVEALVATLNETASETTRLAEHVITSHATIGSATGNEEYRQSMEVATMREIAGFDPESVSRELQELWT